MKYIVRNLLAIIIMAFSILTACKKKEGLPVVTTIQVTGITDSDATSGGLVTDEGSSNVTARGVCWSNATAPLISDNKTIDGNGAGSFTSKLTGLSGNMTYYIRAYATNSSGTEYGGTVSFTSIRLAPASTIKDVEGNTYNVITIGTQVWMQENLKTTRYNNGEIILTTTSPALDITNEIKPKYQWDSNMPGYGRQYTYYALTDERKVCPEGWHVPTDDEWTILTDYLTGQGYGYEGSGDDIAKSLAAKAGWIADLAAGNVGNDQQNNNSSGFTGYAAGGRYSNGKMSFIGYHGIWGTSTESSETSAFFRCIGYIPGQVFRGVFNKSYGLSVRCLID